MSGLDGWNDDLGADPESGEIPDPPAPSADAVALVAALLADPAALAMLKDALGIGEQEKDKLNVFATSAEFLEEYLVRVFRKHLASSRLKWCEQWWEHVEARVAIEAIWERWEVDRKTKGGIAHWLVYYGWPVMDRLTGEHSPFDGCQHTVTDEKGRVILEAVHAPVQKRLPIGIAPDDLFARVPTKANPNPEN